MARQLSSRFTALVKISAIFPAILNLSAAGFLKMNETSDQSHVVTRRATFDEILQVRWDVLRPNRPVEPSLHLEKFL
jgi:hypothetical protein